MSDYEGYGYVRELEARAEKAEAALHTASETLRARVAELKARIQYVLNEIGVAAAHGRVVQSSNVDAALEDLAKFMRQMAFVSTGQEEKISVQKEEASTHEETSAEAVGPASEGGAGAARSADGERSKRGLVARPSMKDGRRCCRLVHEMGCPALEAASRSSEASVVDPEHNGNCCATFLAPGKHYEHCRQRLNVEAVPEPAPMILHCPECKMRHIDVGEFATKAHHTHSCQGCGLTWRPAVVPTVGVQFLPGFKSGPNLGEAAHTHDLLELLRILERERLEVSGGAVMARISAHTLARLIDVLHALVPRQDGQEPANEAESGK